MKRQIWRTITIALLAVAFTACGLINPPLTTQHDEGDEESGTQFTKDETYDMTRRGARLILSYDANKEAFIGTVENTTSNTLKRVRVEVHLSNGTELGPTTPTDLSGGEKIDVTLDAKGQTFDTWSAHPEVG